MSDKGFTLIEVMISIALLSIAALSLVGVMSVSVDRASSSMDAVIAREKAREAIESVHTARDTGALSWTNIRNVEQGGIFLAGARALTVAGEDGLVNTADDGPVESQKAPGYDGILDTEDDIVTPLTHFRREIRITDLQADQGGINPNLREITVNIRYQVRGMWRTYSLRTYVSAFS
jgi:prepilin-type N-terminal cleavage/methylation domain-containing protein